MRRALLFAGLLPLLVAGCGSSEDSGPTVAPTSGSDVLTGTLDRLNGEPEDLSKYQGKVVLVVNTATECGFTPQFEALETLYKEKKGEGFVILGFPADDVAGQEPRDDEAIAEFCKANFGVSFPMFSKSNIVDAPLNPLYKKINPVVGAPTWNFNKTLLDRTGKPLQRWGPETEPDDPELSSAIDQQLNSR